MSGAAGDEIGKERVFTSGAFLFCTASVLLLFARTGEQTIILRLFQGAGAGLFSPMIPALLAANRPRNMLTALSYWGMITGAVAALYPFGAAFLMDTFSWRYGWMIVPVVTAIAVLRPPKPRGRADLKTKASAPSIRRILTLPVMSVLGFILISYGISTWFIVTIALSDKNCCAHHNRGSLYVCHLVRFCGRKFRRSKAEQAAPAPTSALRIRCPKRGDGTFMV